MASPLTSHLCKLCFVYVEVLVICRFYTVKNEFQSLQMVCTFSVYKYSIKNTEQTIRLRGSVSQVRMKPECLGKKFECQLYRKKRTSGIVQRPYMIKKQRMKAIKECEKQLLESSTVPERLDVTEASGSSILLNYQN